MKEGPKSQKSSKKKKKGSAPNEPNAPTGSSASSAPNTSGKVPAGEGKQKAKGATVTGIFQSTRRGFAFLSPESQKGPDIFIPASKTGDAEQGDRVSVKLSKEKSGKRREGEVVSILESAQEQLAQKEEFPSDVKKELEKLPPEEDIEKIAYRQERTDLRDTTIITIDPEDAKDIDDGISIRKRPEGGYVVGVHIADVSYYVKEGTALHRETVDRATSIYLVDRVIHMLPPTLSQNLCSLQSQKNRLAMSVIAELDRWGNVERYNVFPSLVKVSMQLSYERAENMLMGEDEKENPQISEMIRDMDELAQQLKDKRVERGALDLNLPEAVIELDDDGSPISIYPKQPRRTESIIEEFMLLANEIVAEHMSQAQLPCIYRVHPRPTQEKMHTFRNILSLLGIKLPGNLKKITPRKIQNILEEVRDTSLEKTVNYILLRSLPHAYYSVENESHFGLASKCYTHFTSPIRRFPDLQVHTVLKEHLKGGPSEERIEWLENILPERAEHASNMEREAMEAERESIDRKKVEYMQGKEGEMFSGIICGVTSFGLFVELENTVEGMIPLEDITDDYYRFYDNLMMVVGKNTGKSYALGEHVTVQVNRIDLAQKTIVFRLVEDEEWED